MKSWIYKCNSTSQSNGPFSGNWEKVFGPDVEIRWGPRSLKGAESVQIGDTFIACQTNRHSLVGVAKVIGFRSGDFLIKPVERIDVQLPKLKKSDSRIAAIKALQGGVIASVYAISDADARMLLGAARKAVKVEQQRFVASKTKKLGAELSELPTGVRAQVLREVRIAVRNAAMRSRVLAVWPAECAACGLAISDNGDVECEVAHVRDVFEDGKDLVENAMPLCRTHHWAYDRHLWCIHPQTLKIHVRSKDVSLKKLQGKKIVRPIPVGDIKPLAKSHLLWRWEKYQLIRATALKALSEQK